MRVLITGGTSGLGSAMAEALRADGHHVVLTGRDADRAAAAAAEIGANGIAMDVRDPDSVRAGRDRVLDLFGGLDVLINNAGIGMRTVNPRFLTEPQPFWEVPEAGFRDVVETNLTGYFLVAKAFVPDLLASPSGRIINITMNHETMRRTGFVPYGPSRAGAESLSRIMAADLADTSVRVNLLLPGGATVTGMIPDGAVDTSKLLPADVLAAPVRWLCSAAADQVHDERIVATEFDEWLRHRRG
ncbi:SDR family oxidoreductase [Amycolatopsis acidiphila]|uniref:SDR family oxidoreductase n=1 Tax=Amycolatopsis acidiphila TaxID=715473 RepID=A0A558AC89_9PSEU|nr:SDR family oxidoreductase [Amycolatopsis acidiphila]TVT21888.1 SDR family oxidoreductase [Amycolatopsis acidiphila]UIJ57305.1 SDR family oxidoreductase [Amycolatopsis acidiphila]GHG84923.1 short-chain dehydrogenase [Amycolatopsis acidiphila]